MKMLKKILMGGALALTLATPLLTPQPADAWGWRGGYGWHGGWHGGWGYHGGWGWHTGWGWRGGVYIGGPAVVVGAPGYYGYGRAWIPAHYNYYGAYIPGHWSY